MFTTIALPLGENYFSPCYWPTGATLGWRFQTGSLRWRGRMFGLLLRTGSVESWPWKVELQTQTQMVSWSYKCLLFPLSPLCPIFDMIAKLFSAPDSSFNPKWPRGAWISWVSPGMHLLTWCWIYNSRTKTVGITRHWVKNQCWEKSPVWLVSVLEAMCSSAFFKGSAFS